MPVNANNFVDDVRASVAEMLPAEHRVDDVNRVRMQDKQGNVLLRSGSTFKTTRVTDTRTVFVTVLPSPEVIRKADVVVNVKCVFGKAKVVGGGVLKIGATVEEVLEVCAAKWGKKMGGETGESFQLARVPAGKLNLGSLKWQESGNMKGLGFRDGATMAVRCKNGGASDVAEGGAGEEKAEASVADGGLVFTEKENSNGAAQSPWRGNVAFVKRKERGISIKKWEGSKVEASLRTESA